MYCFVAVGVDRLEVLDRMAALIRENPSITVREIAARLGYSEERSVYYWLEKARYYGIRSFRRAVLTGQYRPHQFGEYVSEDGAEAVTIRIARGLTAQNTPQFTGEKLILGPGVAEGSFAVRLQSDVPDMGFFRGDVLVADPSSAPLPGELVLKGRAGTFDLVTYNPSETAAFVARVIRLIRSF